MTNREKTPDTGVQQQIPTTQLVWSSRPEWGSPGLTYRAETTIGSTRYSFVVDQVRKGDWVARGWANGEMFFYRDRAAARTLKAMKALASDEVARLLAEDGQ